MITILIADSQAIYRDDIEFFLSAQKDFKLIGIGKDGYEAIKLAVELQPDIVLMDIYLPLIDGARVAAILKYRSPATSIIILSDFNNDESIQQAIYSGAAGYLEKASDLNYLAGVIRLVYNGDCVLSPKIAARVFRFISPMVMDKTVLTMPHGDRMPFPNISTIEFLIISYIGQGFSNKEIAEKLKFKQGTIRNYISSILKKIHLRDRTQIAIFAITQGFTPGWELVRPENFLYNTVKRAPDTGPFMPPIQNASIPG
jgi:DNA-binding NarL/FixJ family response regulator